jgi:hypothetical protein
MWYNEFPLTKGNNMEYTYKLGDRVRHLSEDVKGVVVRHLNIDDVDEDTEDGYPWYGVVWDDEDFVGQEHELSIEKI